MKPPIDDFLKNIVLFEESNVIKVAHMKELWETQGELGVLHWFWNDSWVYEPILVAENE